MPGKGNGIIVSEYFQFWAAYLINITFETTATYVIIFRIPYQAPMSSTRSAKGRRDCVTILYASNRISAILFKSANKGASGKAATNKVTKPYWITGKIIKKNKI